MSDSQKVKNILGIKTEIPKDIDLTRYSFEILRMVEQEGFAKFHLECLKEHEKTLDQIAKICYRVGYKLIRVGYNDTQVVKYSMSKNCIENVHKAEGEYYLFTKKVLKENEVSKHYD